MASGEEQSWAKTDAYKPIVEIVDDDRPTDDQHNSDEQLLNKITPNSGK